MAQSRRIFLKIFGSASAIGALGCNDDVPPAGETGGTTETGDGDGDPATGDGDGDPTTGDGDGDPTTGDGDGDPTTGDGDGDPVCDPPPNVLLILADDIGVDVMRIIGGEVLAQVDYLDDMDNLQSFAAADPLPVLSSLLQHGIHFSKAWANPVCSPTRGSLFTGLHPWRNGVGFPAPTGNSLLPLDDIDGDPIVTLADAIKNDPNEDTPYTIGVFGKWDLLGDDVEANKDDYGPRARGFDHFEGHYRGGVRNPPKKDYGLLNNATPTGAWTGQVTLDVLRNPENYMIPDLDVSQAMIDKRNDAADAAEEALMMLSPSYVDTNPDVRFYIWDKYLEREGEALAMETPAERDLRNRYATIDQISSCRNWIVEKHNECTPWVAALTIIAPHDPVHVPPAESHNVTFSDPPTIQEMLIAMCESMDFYLGSELLNHADAEDALANTVIIFAGDNGTQGGLRDAATMPGPPPQIDCSNTDDKGTIDFSAAHVPFIVVDGGLFKGGDAIYLENMVGNVGMTLENLVHTTDIYATILDIVGSSVPAGIDAVSFAPLLTDTMDTVRSYNFMQQYQDMVTPQTRWTASITDGEYKLSYQENATPGDGYYFSEVLPHTMANGACSDIDGAYTDGMYIPLDMNLTVDELAKAQELHAELTMQKFDFNSTDFPALPV